MTLTLIDSYSAPRQTPSRLLLEFPFPRRKFRPVRGVPKSFRQKSKHPEKLRARFRDRVREYLASVGAREGRFYDLELPTPAGLLHLSVRDDWIACRFEDVSLGRLFTSSCGRHCNPHSGKWNFHFGTNSSFDPEQALAEFRLFLDQLLNWQAMAA